MPDSVIYEREWLCREIPDKEWSGILWYSIEGSIQDPVTFKITIEDIFPMDKGSATYTEYEFDETIVEYRISNPASKNWRMGHIHSHNTMKVFFSSEDMRELNDNSEHHNYYLSLIVNNYGDMTAKIAFRGKQKFTPFYGIAEKGIEYEIPIGNINIEQEILFVYDCNIETNTKPLKVKDSFIQRVKDIISLKIKTKNVISEKPIPNKIITDSQGSPMYPINYPTYPNTFDTIEKNRYEENLKNLIDSEDFEDMGDFDTLGFLSFLLLFGNTHVRVPDFEDVCDSIKLLGKEGEYIKKVINYFEEGFTSWYDWSPNEKEKLNIFKTILSTLDDWISDYGFLYPLIDLIQIKIANLNTTILYEQKT